MKQDKDATTRVAKYSELREEIKNMADTTSINKGKSKKDQDYAPTRTIPINNNEMIDTKALDIEEGIESRKKQFKDAPIFKSYQNKKLLITILYCLIGAIVLGLLIWLIVWMSKTL
jgi:hypothetical protein